MEIVPSTSDLFRRGADFYSARLQRGEELGFTSHEPSETKERKGEGNPCTRPKSGKLEVRRGRGVGLAFGSVVERGQGT